jgi:uncharacterized SAM-dependent methyltransferase
MVLRKSAGQFFGKGKDIVAVGYGKGYDSKWMAEATEADLHVCWVEVSDVSCRWADADIDEQYDKLVSAGFSAVTPEVICGEICQILKDLDSYELRRGSVGVWYFSRTLGCLSAEEAKFVLEKVGSLLSEGDRIVIVNALQDCNTELIDKTCTSNLFPRAMLLDHIAYGAGHPVCVYDEMSFQYFKKNVSALSIGVV